MSVVANPVEHEPDCHGFDSERAAEEGVCRDWCWSHYACEPSREGDFLFCGECFHVYRTGEELLAAYQAASDELYEKYPEDGRAPVPESADKVGFCQHCIHDF